MKLDANDAYALLKPDVVLRGTVSSVLAILQRCGFTVHGFLIGALTDDIYACMYAQSFVWRLDNWSHNREAYAFGPVIGLVLRHSNDLPCEATAQAMLHKLKGSAVPRDLVPGTIRAAASATCRVFNVIHVPDELDGAAREAELWFGPVLNWQVGEAGGRAAVEAEVSAHGYTTEAMVDPEVTYLFVKARLMHSLQWRSSNNELRHRLARLRKMYTSWANTMSVTREADARRGACAQWQGRETAELVELLSGATSERAAILDLRRLITFLCDLQSNQIASTNGLAFLLSQLAAARVYVSSLERYLITTRVLYPA